VTNKVKESEGKKGVIVFPAGKVGTGSPFFTMEKKTTQEQVEYFEDFLPDNKKGNCNEVMKLIVANNRKWIAQDELIKELDKTWNIINKYNMDRHPNYISKTQVAKFLGDLKNAITSLQYRQNDKEKQQ